MRTQNKSNCFSANRILAIVAVLLLCGTTAHAQYVPAFEKIYEQCGPGGCPPCGPHIWRPRPAPSPDDYPEEDYPDEGPNDLPDYQPRPNPNDDPAPADPPNDIPPAPAIPPQPSVDPKVLEEFQKQLQERDNAAKERDEKSILILNDIKVAIEKNGGCKCEPCNLSPLQCRFDEMIAKLDELSVKIGCIPTTPPTPTPMPEEGEQHVVVVADQNAPYWQRLSENITKTKQTYHGIQVAGLPKFPIGTHPQAVVYKNSVPVRIVKGQYECEALLSRLARGEAI